MSEKMLEPGTEVLITYLGYDEEEATKILQTYESEGIFVYKGVRHIWDSSFDTGCLI